MKQFEDYVAEEAYADDGDLHVPGAKQKKGKVRASLVLGDFRFALLEVAKVGTMGAEKYSPHGWLSVPNGFEEYSEAMLRHWLAEHIETVDPESNLVHAAHLAWNALARLELLIRQERFGVPVCSECGEINAVFVKGCPNPNCEMKVKV